jgi:tryptophanyl-tRNA synthetase
METVFSGMQPTGEMHLGNYLGAVRSWVDLQDKYRCFYCIVDYHAITQPYEPAELARRTREMAIDVLACGIDPERATLFVQSAVPEHTELAWALSSVAPYGELGRMTQFKDKAEHHPDHINAGLFTYPVLQTADILLYGATRVPVGEDQRQHLELAREIVRRWNARFGQTFEEPQPLFSTTPKILGLDGQAKMSKSLGNTISLREDDKAIWEKLRTAATDPARARRTDPGNPDICPVFDLHRLYTDDATREWAAAGCRSASIGCLDCKAPLIERVVEEVKGMRKRAQEFQENPELIPNLLHQGGEKAREAARETLDDVRRAMHLRS